MNEDTGGDGERPAHEDTSRPTDGGTPDADGRTAAEDGATDAGDGQTADPSDERGSDADDERATDADDDETTVERPTDERSDGSSSAGGPVERVTTGVAGLDAILEGGYFAERTYLLAGGPGTGKTLFGLAFLDAEPEEALFVNLEEDVDDLRRNAASVGIDTDGIDFLDLSPGAEAFEESYSVFEASDVEREPITDRIREVVADREPSRVVIDPISQFRYLTSDDYQFRKQIVGLARFLKRSGATTVLTAKSTATTPSDDLQFLSDGNVVLSRTENGRRLAVPKFRGSGTRSGDHAFRITDDGVRVFPELEPGEPTDAVLEPIPSGVPELDELTNGGLERGTISVIAGPTGVGKTTLGTQFAKEAAGRGERSVVYLFEENRQTFLRRSESINVPVRQMLERGTLELQEIEALELSPQEFAARVREEVEDRGAEIVMIDGLAGYELTVRAERADARRRLHALGRYLKNRGVTTILIDETSDVTGPFRATEEGISYLTDNIVFLRHVELAGEMRKVIGVLKKRTSDFERTLREFQITEHGIKIGEPMTRLRGVLSGTPEWIDDDRSE